MATKVWRGTKGELFHDACFMEGESRDGYTPVESLDDLADDDSCESCDGVFLSGLDPDDPDDPDEPDDEVD